MTYLFIYLLTYLLTYFLTRDIFISLCSIAIDKYYGVCKNHIYRNIAASLKHKLSSVHNIFVKFNYLRCNRSSLH